MRTILDPDHLGADGKLAVAAISLEDIRYRGWSVDRKAFTSLWRLKLTHGDWKKKKPNILNTYVLPIQVSEIRLQNQETGEPDFVVIDTAMWLNPAHAVVLLSKPQSQSAARGLRNNLLKKLPPYVDIANAFDRQNKYCYIKGMLYQFAAIAASAFRHIFGFFKSEPPPENN
jgi:hypothetical protein